MKKQVQVLKFKELALKIAQEEGKKRELPIGQINEVLRLTLRELAQADIDVVEKLLKRYKPKSK